MYRHASPVGDVSVSGASGRFRPPRSRRSSLRREALLNELHAGIGQGLIVVHAPAGFGKTALLADFVEDVDYTTRWLALDGSSSIPEVFAEQVASAILGASRATPPSSVGRTGDLQAYLGALMAGAAQSDDPILLVIDNVHELNANDETLELLGWLTEAIPDGFEVILSGRSLPPLTSLDASVAAGDVLALDSAMLAFSEDEIAALCQHEGVDVRPSEIAAATAGWPIAVMAVISGTIGLDGARRRAQGAAWERFVNSQVWNAVPERLQPALLEASIRPVIEARIRGGRRPELLEWLNAHDFLCEPLGANDVRLNQMFGAFLRGKFAATDPDGFAAAVHAAISEAEQAGQLSDAMELARSTSQFDALADLIETHGSDLLLRGAFSLLWHSIEAIPADVIEERDLLAGIRARVQTHIGRLNEALDSASVLLDDPEVRGAARLHALLARVRGLRFLGNMEDMHEAFGSVRAVRCDNALLLSELNYYEAEIVLWVENDLVRAEQLLRQTIRQAHLSNARILELLATSTLGQVLTMRGDGPGAVTTLTRAVEGWRSVGRSSNLGWSLNNLGMAHLLAGDFESAASVLEQARDEGIQCENRRNQAYATASLGDADLALGHFALARQRYEEAIALCAEHTADQTLAALSIAGLSAALLGMGDLEQADFFSRRALLVAASAGNAFELGSCKLQQAAVDSAAGRHDDAISLAADARQLFTGIESHSSVSLAEYRLALCEFRAGKRPEAQVTLARLAEGLSEPWMVATLMPLIRENPMFAQWAASRNLAGTHFREYVARQAFEIAGAATDEPDVRIEALPVVNATSLGAASVTVAGREVTDEMWSSARAKELFYLFLSHRSAPLRKEEAVELLYPDLPREKTNSAFHSNLYRLRKALYQESVVKRDGGYTLNPQGTFAWDVEAYMSALDRADALPAGSQERAASYKEALSLYRGPFAEAFYSEWAASLRERLADRSHNALAVLAGYYAGRAEYDAAANCIERVLDDNPLNEEAAYQLATYRSKAGNPAAAIAFLDSYRRTYESEFGEALPQRFRELRAGIAAGALAG